MKGIILLSDYAIQGESYSPTKWQNQQKEPPEEIPQTSRALAYHCTFAHALHGVLSSLSAQHIYSQFSYSVTTCVRPATPFL